MALSTVTHTRSSVKITHRKNRTHQQAADLIFRPTAGARLVSEAVQFVTTDSIQVQAVPLHGKVVLAAHGSSIDDLCVEVVGGLPSHVEISHVV